MIVQYQARSFKAVGIESARPRSIFTPTARAAPIVRAQSAENQGSVDSATADSPPPSDTPASPSGKFAAFGSTEAAKKPKAKKQKGVVIRREKVIGSRRPGNYFWAVVVTGAAIAFLRNGLFGVDDFTEGQRITQSLYGGLSVVSALYLWGQLVWGVGDGFNEYNKATKMVRLFRWGPPGKQRRFDLKVPFEDVAFVELGGPKDGIFLRLRGKMEVRVTSKGYLMTEEEIEYRGAELAKFLKCTIKKRTQT